MAARANGAAETVEVFDLDVLAREDAKAPFTFRVEGQTFTLTDPEELDWHAEADLSSGDLARIFSTLLGDDFAAFDKLAVPSWKLEKLMRAWSGHYGIDIPEFLASPDSSVTTVAPSRPTSAATTMSGSRTSQPGG